MYRIISALFLLIFFASITYAEPFNSVYSHRHRYIPHSRITTRPHYYTNKTISRNNLDALERYALRKRYSRDTDISRLQRLEELTFGSIQAGDINTRYDNVEKAILSRPQSAYYNRNNSIINRLGSYFTGQTTGFTPNIIPDTPEFTHNMFGQNNRAFDQYSNNFFGNNLRYFDHNNLTHSAVKILD